MSNLADAWKDPSIPQRQWDAIAGERKLVSEGRAREVAPYRAMDECLHAIAKVGGLPIGADILEIGASSGFYSRVIESMGWEINYIGLDYSQSFKDFAEKVHPDIPYHIGDVTNLENINTNKYDIVISGCCLLHIPDWRAAMRETVRVARDYVIFHRTPLVDNRGTFTFEKEAYGVKCQETWFNRMEFMMIVADLGLEVIKEVEVFKTPDYSHVSIVCAK